MRKFLLTLAAGTAGALLLGASVPYARTLSGQIKVVNTQGHSATQRIARAEAPLRQAPKMKDLLPLPGNVSKASTANTAARFISS